MWQDWQGRWDYTQELGLTVGSNQPTQVDGSCEFRVKVNMSTLQATTDQCPY